MMKIKDLYVLFKYLMVIALIGGFLYLLVLSAIVRDYGIIVNRPIIFTIELMFFMFLPAIPLLFFYESRNISWREALVWFGSLAGKFGAFHIVFQLSGFYSYLFSK